MTDKYPIQPAAEVAEVWESWCGDTPWSKALREFGSLGGLIRYWCGVPRCASAIPLTFELFAPDGTSLPCRYRLRDIRDAVTTLRNKVTA